MPSCAKFLMTCPISRIDVGAGKLPCTTKLFQLLPRQFLQRLIQPLQVALPFSNSGNYQIYPVEKAREEEVVRFQVWLVRISHTLSARRFPTA
jgi:hypothetical protein